MMFGIMFPHMWGAKCSSLYWEREAPMIFGIVTEGEPILLGIVSAHIRGGAIPFVIMEE